MINLTPHVITLQTRLGDTITVPPSGTVARVTTVSTVAGDFDASGQDFPGADGDMLAISVIKRTFGEVEGLPEDTSRPVLVSALVLSAVPGRPNTFAPDTGPSAVRDEHGQIVAVTRLVAA